MARRNPIRDIIRFVSMSSTITYCFGFADYLSPYASHDEGYSSSPTMIGLTAIGVITALCMAIFLIRAFFHYSGLDAESQVSPARASGVSDTSGDFDADDAIARYLAKSRDEPVAAPAPQPASTRTGFGRKFN
jgi:hypothetical protein